MTAQPSAPIPLHQPLSAAGLGDDMTLLTVVDQLNYLTERLAVIEEQLANGTLIINQQPTGHLRLTSNADSAQPPRVNAQSGWQPTRR